LDRPAEAFALGVGDPEQPGAVQRHLFAPSSSAGFVCWLRLAASAGRSSAIAIGSSSCGPYRTRRHAPGIVGRMSKAIERFLDAATVLGHPVDVRRFPEGTKTAPDAARAIGCEVGQIVKSLVFVADGEPVLALTSGANRVDVGRLATLAGASAARRADPEEARAATGFAVGGTPPFGHPEPIRTFLDPDLLAFEEVWAAAGTPDAVFRTTATELQRTTAAEVVDLKETGSRNENVPPNR
jgi:prolyl-tRNA editing enzyme YbaK/EbsC (Cys-tRNA(Pro) deacylase)